MREKDGLSQENLLGGEVWLKSIAWWIQVALHEFMHSVYVLYMGRPPKIWVFTPQIHQF